MIGIYGLQNKLKPEKWYIGQSRNIKNRWKKYQYLQCKRQPKLYNALQKYGWEGFTRVILEECANDSVLLKEREAYWANHYKAVESGYNIETPGIVKTFSPETREKMRKSQLGRKHSDETKRKISKSRIGCKISDETVAKRLATRKSRTYIYTPRPTRKRSDLETKNHQLSERARKARNYPTGTFTFVGRHKQGSFTGECVDFQMKFGVRKYILENLMRDGFCQKWIVSRPGDRRL